MGDISNGRTVIVQVVDRPARKLILKRGGRATHYFEFCEEVGCHVWGILCAVPGTLSEPVGMWLPDNLRREGTSLYAQGVEVPLDFAGEVPEGFELIGLAPCRLLFFQGAPFEDGHFGPAIEELGAVMERYDPSVYGYEWADADCPRFQLEPQGRRGYIEARPVRPVRP